MYQLNCNQQIYMINLLARVIPKSMLLTSSLLAASTVFGKASFSTTSSFDQAFSSEQEPANSPIEDRLAFLKIDNPSMFLFGVFDGHGGHAVAEYASSQMPKIIQEKLKDDTAHSEEGIKKTLIESF